MHPEAYEFIRNQIDYWLRENPHPRVVEFGSCDVNGSPRSLLGSASYYTGIDLVPGPGVDIVMDAADWEPDGEYDLAICTEVFEHTPRWEEICMVAYRSLREDGIFIVTAATDPRPPHSAVDGHNLADGENEYYRNVDREELMNVLFDCGFIGGVSSTHERGDVYAMVMK